MSAKRGDRAAPPPRPNGYVLRFATNDAAKGWEELCRQAAASTRAAFDAIEANPCPAHLPAGSTRSRAPCPLNAQTGEYEFVDGGAQPLAWLLTTVPDVA